MTAARILVVDDNAVNTKLVSFLLGTRGYQVRTAESADEAMSAVRDFHPELILMDIQLPGTDGLTLARRLKADPDTQHTFIVAVTAYAMKGDDARALEAGCDAYMTKPIDTRAFPAQIEEYLASGAARTGGER